LLVQKQHHQSLFHLLGLEASRPAPALVRHPARAVDDIQAIRHAAVRMPDPIIELIHQERHGDGQGVTTFLGNCLPFVARARLPEIDAFLNIIGQLPAVRGMSLADINRQELDAILIAFMDFLQVPKLGPVRTSGKVAENQDHGFLAPVLRQADLFLAVLGFEREIRRHVLDSGSFKDRPGFPL